MRLRCHGSQIKEGLTFRHLLMQWVFTFSVNHEEPLKDFVMGFKFRETVLAMAWKRD